MLVRESKYGMGLAELVARTGLTERQIATAAADAPVVASSSRRHGSWIALGSTPPARSCCARCASFIKRTRCSPGIPKQDLRGRELPDSPPFFCRRDTGAGAADRRRRRKRAAGRPQLVLKEDEEQARSAIERAFENAGLAVPALPDVLAKSGVEAARARSLLQILLREKRLVRVSDDLVFHRSAMENLRAMLAAHKAARFNVGTFKDWTGISRKYAIPLLEYLDRERVTRREGDERVVL